MAPKVKSVVSALSDALETAAGWALLAAGLYAAIFVDMTGGGSLWNSIRGLTGHAMAAAPAPAPGAVRVVKVATLGQPSDPNQERFLVVSESKPASSEQTVAVAAPEAVRKPDLTLVDTPADPQAGKTWKKGLKGDLRKFTVYGEGESTTSASAGGSVAAASSAGSQPAAIAAATGSAARAGSVSAAGARPGVGSRLSSGGSSGSDSVRNIR